MYCKPACPVCGKHKVTINVDVIISCTIDDNGYPTPKHYWTADPEELKAAIGISPEWTAFCDKCSSELKILQNKEGQIRGFEKQVQ